jgi:hypothetical protein
MQFIAPFAPWMVSFVAFEANLESIPDCLRRRQSHRVRIEAIQSRCPGKDALFEVLEKPASLKRAAFHPRRYRKFMSININKPRHALLGL